MISIKFLNGYLTFFSSPPEKSIIYFFLPCGCNACLLSRDVRLIGKNNKEIFAQHCDKDTVSRFVCRFWQVIIKYLRVESCDDGAVLGKRGVKERKKVKQVWDKGALITDFNLHVFPGASRRQNSLTIIKTHRRKQRAK